MTTFQRAAFGLLLALAMAGPLAAQQPAPAGDPVRGRATYLANGCHNCHGSVGQGGGPGPVLAQTRMSYAGFAHQIRTPMNIMPAYADPLMSDEDLADVYAYLKGLPGKSAPKDMPAILAPR